MEWSRYVKMEVSQDTRKPMRNYDPPTPTTNISSHFPRVSCSSRRHYFSVASISLFWLVILVWCSPHYVAYGFPIVLTSRSPPLNEDAILDSSLMYRRGDLLPQWWWPRHSFQDLGQEDEDMDKSKQIQEIDDNDEDDDNVQETTGLSEPTGDVVMMMVHPRSKKGLSYFTKYYSEAFLNNTPSSSGGGGGGSSSANSSAQSHDSSNHFFGVSASKEQRFPSSVRRKLAFYPPLTSHSTFMSPWSRVSSSGYGSGGRSPTMRLRWGR